MRTFLSIFLIMLTLAPARAENVTEPETAVNHDTLQEVVIASKITEMTGIAMNPLLVGGTMRAWDYLQTPAEQRQLLHWTAQPWFWGSLLSIGLLFLLNGTIGRVFPPSAKLMDAVETLEGKLSPVYTAPMLIPVGIQLVDAIDHSGLMPISNAVADPVTAAPLTLAADPVTVTLGTLLALFITGILWLTNQAIHTIVLLSPFGLISLLVRVLQFGVIGILLLAAAIHPLLGMLCALLIIFISIRIAGWSFRLSIFGSVLAWDLLWRKRRHPVNDQITVFTGPAISKIPARTLATLTKDHDGNLLLNYRPWLMMPRRQIALQHEHRILTHGVFFSQIRQKNKGDYQAVLTLPPRYRDHEEALMQYTDCESMRPSTLKGGLSAAINWLRSWHSPSSSTKAP